jgi:hypothetical protein
MEVIKFPNKYKSMRYLQCHLYEKHKNILFNIECYGILFSGITPIYTHYIHSVVVQDYVSGRVCCVNQYHYELR